MNDKEFHDRVDAILLKVEDSTDALALDVDVDSSSGTLAITFDNGSAIIMSRQSATQELWVAARSGGFHLRFTEDKWFCDTSGEALETLINRVFSEQSGSPQQIL